MRNRFYHFVYFFQKNNPISKNSGFTLMEILIVLAILGAIFGFITKGVMGNMQKANVKEAKLIIGQASNEINNYFLECAKYPPSLETLIKGDESCKNYIPNPDFKKVPKDPWKHDLVYELTDGGYNLKSLGKDGKEGGSGFDQDISKDDIE